MPLFWNNSRWSTTNDCFSIWLYDCECLSLLHSSPITLPDIPEAYALIGAGRRRGRRRLGCSRVSFLPGCIACGVRGGTMHQLDSRNSWGVWSWGSSLIAPTFATRWWSNKSKFGNDWWSTKLGWRITSLRRLCRLFGSYRASLGYATHFSTIVVSPTCRVVPSTKPCIYGAGVTILTATDGASVWGPQFGLIGEAWEHPVVMV